VYQNLSLKKGFPITSFAHNKLLYLNAGSLSLVDGANCGKAGLSACAVGKSSILCAWWKGIANILIPICMPNKIKGINRASRVPAAPVYNPQ
jgi:hypothetical protein